MNLLSDLTLNYEMLADDPIEVGIHYGQSILQVLSSKVTAAENFVQQQHPNLSRLSSSADAPRKISRPDYRALLSRTVSQEAPTRRSFIDYSARSQPTYSRRTLVGAL